MDMKDPARGAPWTPDQFWVCPKCGRHFWTTYPAAPGSEKSKASPAPAGKAAAAAGTKPVSAQGGAATAADATATAD